jgi:peptidoglycan/xylan/chitin deacetylase (PgdA/CDA1 family)
LSVVPLARIVLYAASLGLLVMTGRALVIGPPGVTVAALALGGYLLLILLGVLRLGLRMFVDAIVAGPRDARGVALTFDDGPDPKTTVTVLDALDDAKAKATFFVIGKKAEEHPEIVREILRRGHEIGLHSYAHDRLFSLRSEKEVRRDLEKGVAVLTELTGEKPLFFRPPIGHTNPILARVVDDLDLVTVGWSVSARDGVKSAIPRAVVNRVRRGLEDGAIVLMHDASEKGTHVPAGVIALPEVLKAAYRQQLPLVTVGSWLATTSGAEA